MKNFIFILSFCFTLANSSDIKELEQKCEDNVSIVPCDLAAEMYFFGDGVEIDYKKAKKFYAKACDGGLYSACSNLGVIYEKGYGVKSDLQTAKKLYEISCDGEVSKGCQNLADIYNKDDDQAKAIEYHEKGCKFGAWMSCEFLAKFYEKKEAQTAARYYDKACRLGKEEMRGQFPVGIMKVKLACDKASELE